MTEVWRVVGFAKKIVKKDNFESQYLGAYGPEFKTLKEAEEYLEKINPPFDIEVLLMIQKFYKFRK